jgi:hypothetical protein
VPVKIKKGGTDMVTNEKSQGWQELQDRIESVFGPLLRGDIQRIEYKPLAVVPLLGMSPGYRENKSPEIK